jgi:hypothetical protein
MITTCLGSAAMHNVDDSSANNSRKPTYVMMEHVTESTDDSEKLRRDSTSVKSTTAFQFWSSYVGECGGGRGKRESTSPQSVDQESPGASRDASRATMPGAYSRGVAPASGTLNTILDRSVDIACFSVTPSLSEDNPKNGPKEEPDVSSTPRVSCSIEITGRRGLSRTYNVLPKVPCRGNQDPTNTSVQNQCTRDSVGIRENEELTTNPSQESDGADGLTPDPTLSIVSSGYEDGLTPDPTISIQSSYVPASYSNLNSSKQSQPLSSQEFISSQQQKILPSDPASSDTVTAGSSLRCHPDSSPTFTHYSLLIAKGSVDSDDLFAALSSSTKSGVSVRDLQLPVSSLSATTFLSSPSATTVDGSDRLQVDVTTSGVEVPVPTSTKSTFSTVISSMSSFSIDEPKSKSSKSGTYLRSYIESVRSNEPDSVSLKPENFTASTDTTSAASDPPIAEGKKNNIVVKMDFPATAKDRSWIRKEREAVNPQGAKEMDKEVVEKVVSSEGSSGTTELTAQETMSTTQTMEESLCGEITERVEGTATQVSRISRRAAGAEEHGALPSADPFEWAYEIWRAKGLISDFKPSNGGPLLSAGNESHSQKKALESIAPPKRAAVQQRDVSTEDERVQVHHMRMSLISNPHSKPASSKDKEVAKDDDFSTILQRWRKKSDVHPDLEQAKTSFAPDTVDIVEERGLLTDVENQMNDEELREVWESSESAENAEQASYTRDVWSPFIPRPPSPKTKGRSPSPAVRRSLSQLPSSPSPSRNCSRMPSPCTPQNSNERPPISGSGRKTTDSQVKPVLASSETVAADGHYAQQVERPVTLPAPRRIVDDELRSDPPVHPVSQAGKMAAGKGPEWVTASPIPKRNVTLPKSNSDYKSAVQTVLHAVENNDLDLLKSYSNQSDDERAEMAVAMKKSHNACPKEETLKPSIKDRRKPWHDSRGSSFPAACSIRKDKEAGTKTSRSQAAPVTSIRTPESEQQRKKDAREVRSLCNTDELTLCKSLVYVSPGQRNDLNQIQRTPGHQQMGFPKQELHRPATRESCSSTVHQIDVRLSESNASPATMFRSPMTRGRETTRLSPGESLIGKTIQVPSSIKKKPGYSLNESAESGTWVRLLSLESAGADDSVDFDGAVQVRFDEAGRAEDTHPWRRDMVVRKVNSFDGDFSVRTSLFEESCQCASSAFSGKDELVEFYLPKMGM